MFLILPVGDSPNPDKYRPWVNWGLICINIAIFIFVSYPLMDGDTYGAFVREYGFVPKDPGFVSLFSCMFLHGSWMHLAGNMLFLWIYGDNIEHRLGRLGYLFTYLLTGIAATLTFGLMEMNSVMPMIGASGAISGVLGLYLLLFPRNRIHIFVWLLVFVRTISIPAKWVLLFYILVENLLPQFLGSQDGVAYGAHIGGFFAGCLVAVIGERMAWRWPWVEEPIPASPAPRFAARIRKKTQPPTLRSVPASPSSLKFFIAEGASEDAISSYGQMGRQVIPALTPAECAQLAQWLFEREFPAAANQLIRQAIHSHRQAENKEQAHLYLALGLIRLKQNQPTAAFQHLMVAAELNLNPEITAKAKEALASFQDRHPETPWHLPHPRHKDASARTPDTHEEHPSDEAD
jgi:membrane associated rhomboid family serine protease